MGKRKITPKQRKEFIRLERLMIEEDERVDRELSFKTLESLADTTIEANIDSSGLIYFNLQLGPIKPVSFVAHFDDVFFSVSTHQGNGELMVEGPAKQVKALLKPYRIKLTTSEAFRTELKAFIKRLIVGMQLTKD